MYDASYAEKFKQHSLFSFEQPIWHIKSSYDIQKKLKELILLLQNISDESAADRVDILCKSHIRLLCISARNNNLCGCLSSYCKQ